MRLLAGLFFWAISMPYYANAQKIQNIPFTQRIADVEQQQLLQVLPLFQLIDSKVFQPIDFSADNGQLALVSSPIILPKDISNGIHAYGFVYHQHGTGLFPNHTLILVERPANLQTIRTRVWVDVQNDLDLSNDSFFWFNPSKPLSISIDGKENGYKVELSIFEKTQLKSIQSMYESAIGMIKQDRVYLGVNHSFREKRLNTFFGSQIIGKETIYWGLKDVNSNGAITDNGVDLIVVAEAKNRFELQNSKPYYPGQQFVWLGRRFQIAGFDTNTRSLQVRIVQGRITRKQKKESKSLLIGQKMPRFKFCKIVELPKGKNQLATEKKLSEKQKAKENRKKVKRTKFYKLKPHKGMRTLVVIWNAFDETWNQDSTMYHQLGRLKNDSFQVVMLNYGGSGRYVYRYNKTYDVFAKQGFLTPSLIEKLKVQTMPQSILLDDKFRVQEINPDLYSLYIIEKSRPVKSQDLSMPF